MGLRTMAWVGLVALAGLAPASAAAAETSIEARRGCRSTPAVADPAFLRRGRAFVANGTPRARSQAEGTKRVLGAVRAENELEPPNVKRVLSFEADVAGDFTVCPCSRERPGSM